jgi:hypothetical protein
MADRGTTQAIRCNNGPELTSRHFLACCIEHIIELVPSSRDGRSRTRASRVFTTNCRRLTLRVIREKGTVQKARRSYFDVCGNRGQVSSLRTNPEFDREGFVTKKEEAKFLLDVGYGNRGWGFGRSGRCLAGQRCRDDLECGNHRFIDNTPDDE